MYEYLSRLAKNFIIEGGNAAKALMMDLVYSNSFLSKKLRDILLVVELS